MIQLNKQEHECIVVNQILVGKSNIWNHHLELGLVDEHEAKWGFLEYSSRYGWGLSTLVYV